MKESKLILSVILHDLSILFMLQTTSYFARTQTRNENTGVPSAETLLQTCLFLLRSYESNSSSFFIGGIMPFQKAHALFPKSESLSSFKGRWLSIQNREAIIFRFLKKPKILI